MAKNLNPRAQAIRALIHEFVKQRAELKTAKMEEGSAEYLVEMEKFEPLAWLEGAVSRSKSLQVVTHPLKASYPDAGIRTATSLFCAPEQLTDQGLVSSACLRTFMSDVTGNAAALDVYDFLLQEFEGETLLSLCLADDPDMQAALHPDTEIAREWVQEFSQIVQPKTECMATHSRAKQIFWLTGNDAYQDENYAILAPLYSSPLAQEVYLQIRADRFGEEANEVREARKANKPHEAILRIYPELAVQKIGGANPQNITRLNSVRRGNNYLLASLPPVWNESGLKPPLNEESAFTRFKWRTERYGWGAHYWLDALKEFLKGNPPAVLQTRNRIQALLNGLMDELLAFALIHQELPAGWSAEPDCRLPLAHKCWLDPGRALTDEKFAQQWLNSDWEAQVEKDFSRWLLHQLEDCVHYLSDVEFRHWAKELRNNNQWRFGIGDQRKHLEAALDEGFSHEA